jgi:hypothetical protein
MRDLTTYPITKQEIINCLTSIGTDAAKDAAPGNMEPLLLRAATYLIQNMDFTTFDLAMMDGKQQSG